MSDMNRVSIYQAYAQKCGVSSDADDTVPHATLPRGVWIPRRSCFRDWLISAFAVRWTRESYEVALFLAEDLWLLERGSGVKWMWGSHRCHSEPLFQVVFFIKRPPAYKQGQLTPRLMELTSSASVVQARVDGIAHRLPTP